MNKNISLLKLFKEMLREKNNLDFDSGLSKTTILGKAPQKITITGFQPNSKITPEFVQDYLIKKRIETIIGKNNDSLILSKHKLQTDKAALTLINQIFKDTEEVVDPFEKSARIKKPFSNLKANFK